ncbi:MAG: dockerin type I repeat-containing protein, partial [Clostridia bacterium]|nr:dockerin type I repeat-containing protein [Clostridia bacterium]
MKKLICLLLALLTALSAYAVSSFAATSDGRHGYQACDADDDDRVNMKDVLLVRRYIAGVARDRDIDLLAADANGDTYVNMSDVLVIKRVIIGIAEPTANNSDSKYKVDKITIGGKNVSRFNILIPRNADSCMSYSSDKLKSYIKKACGITLNVVNSKTNVDSYFIEYRLDPDNEYELGCEGYNIQVENDGDMVITCGSKRGCMYATFYLLEKELGYRFLTEGIEYLYASDGVEIPAGYNETEVPTFSYRGLNQVGPSTSNFMTLRLNAVDATGSGAATNARYGGGVGNLYIHGHSYAYQMAGWEYAYNNSAIDTMGLFNKQPCLTSDETFEKIM